MRFPGRNDGVEAAKDEAGCPYRHPPGVKCLSSWARPCLLTHCCLFAALAGTHEAAPYPQAESGG